MTLIRALDVEADGLEPSDPLVEVGWCDIILDHVGDLKIDQPQSELCNPGRPMSAQARGIHHIADAEVAKARDSSWVMRDVLSEPDVLAAHNIDYERQYVGIPTPWLCSYKCALRIFPEAPDHKLQTLRYWLDLPVDFDLAMPPHRAGPDAYVCAHLVAHLLTLQPLETLIRWSNGPALLVKVGFGKHRGKKFEDAVKEDVAYFRDWVLKNFAEDKDVDIRATTKFHLRKLGAL